MGLDLAVLGILAVWFSRCRCHIVYECADIVSKVYGPAYSAKALRALERWALGRCARVVVTSPLYASEYFVKQQRQPPSRFFLLENKVPNFMPPRRPSDLWTGQRPLCVGYFGLLRDPLAWETMLRWARLAAGGLQMTVRGYPFGIKGIQQDIDGQSNINFGGEYVYPDDLPKMYREIDIVWVTYPRSSTENGDVRWQWPRTNRFYEACYFGKPLVGQTGSADGDMIEAYDIGITIDTAHPEQALDRLLAVSPSDIERWTESLRQLPPQVYMYTDEHRRLLEAVR